MKACIVTFQAAYNYGAVLQAYALQEFMNENFCHTRILEYHSEKIDASYRNPQLIDFIKKPKNAIFKTLQSILYYGKKEKIDQFRREHLLLTQRYDEKNILQAQDEADVFITGSDQVWNYLIVEKDSTYYLGFAKDKKTCSYAASFGVSEIPQEYHDFYEQNLKHLGQISVREKKGIELVRLLSGREAKVLPDPTLLMDCEIWDSLSITPNEKEKYILVYKITKADKLLEFAKELSKKNDLKIIYIPNDLKSGSIGTLKTSVGPKEWLGYIKNAEYVVTNSFHGTVFSILFNKKFFVEVSKKVNPSTSRLESLLEMFEFENRTIDRFTDTMLEEQLNADKIKNILLEQRKHAYNFFQSFFKQENISDLIN